MEEKKQTETSAQRIQRDPPTKGQHRGRYPFELRLRAVKFHLEEGYSLGWTAEQLKLNKKTLYDWVKRYGELGEQGLREGVHGGGDRRSKLAPAVKKKIVELKKQHPSFGVKRIAQFLRRVLFLPASAETVRRTLHKAELLEARKDKPARSAPKPRFFERSTPNQMWQSDIYTFRLGGKNAYLIGFIDDYSRYVVGLGLFRSPSAEHVLEVYRRAVSEYGVPKEILTDRGRQYTNWRGKTGFEAELGKDRVHHIKSAPHHPMTLGKIERFWKTIWEDFLSRAQFANFDEALERIALWHWGQT